MNYVYIIEQCYELRAVLVVPGYMASLSGCVRTMMLTRR